MKKSLKKERSKEQKNDLKKKTDERKEDLNKGRHQKRETERREGGRGGIQKELERKTSFFQTST